MRTRFSIILMSLAVALALPACQLLTDSGNAVALTPGHGHGTNDSTGTGGPPPPPPSGFSIGVSGDSMATAGRESHLQVFAENHDATVDTVNYRFSGPEGWPGFPATGSLVVLGNASAIADIPVAVPAGTASGLYLFHYEIAKPIGTVLQSGDFGLEIHPS